MKVLVVPTAERAATRAAGLVADCLNVGDRPVLGLATGSTMEPVYADLVARFRTGAISFSGATTFNLDEYVGLSPDHPQSYRRTMHRLLFDHVDIDVGACHLPQGDAPDPHVEAQRYDAAIAAAGGIDIQLLGIGRNGHIGFNEPTSSLGARTRIKTLTRSTRQANAAFFAKPEDVPRHAITMGIANILEARHCVLVATGAAKAGAVARMIEGPLGADCPATALQLHARATVIVDGHAAAGLELIDYYQEIHPDGEEPVLV
ncbi:MAG: glucosamine-6-phosphate deaminase [Roseitalea sp.]|jgi:glucosamine-6-phosphate deaminase|nr:glucosamine-6-phosphate deaminase [Roseitalea sp.]MBO6720246.1 glucosamine-6-phosphate deaminase [Roseitalea sp.]MBO6742606.1 glucosamine-6-phosphate deaminase [Roseitalea sp.]